MAKSDIIVREELTTVINETEISVGPRANASVSLDPWSASVRLGGGDGSGKAEPLEDSVTISSSGTAPRTADSEVKDTVYISSQSPDEGTLTDKGPWGELVTLAMDAGSGRVSIGGKDANGSISLLRGDEQGRTIQTGRIDAETGTISVGGGLIGSGASGTVVVRDRFGAMNGVLDADEATLRLGSGGLDLDDGQGSGGGSGGSDDSGGSTGLDSINIGEETPTGDLEVPEGATQIGGSSGTNGAIELVSESGSTAGFVRVENGSLVIADGDGTSRVRLPQGDPQQRLALLDDNGTPALEVEDDGTVMVQGSEVVTQ